MENYGQRDNGQAGLEETVGKVDRIIGSLVIEKEMLLRHASASFVEKNR